MGSQSEGSATVSAARGIRLSTSAKHDLPAGDPATPRTADVYPCRVYAGGGDASIIPMPSQKNTGHVRFSRSPPSELACEKDLEYECLQSDERSTMVIPATGSSTALGLPLPTSRAPVIVEPEGKRPLSPNTVKRIEENRRRALDILARKQREKEMLLSLGPPGPAASANLSVVGGVLSAGRPIFQSNPPSDKMASDMSSPLGKSEIPSHVFTTASGNKRVSVSNDAVATAALMLNDCSRGSLLTSNNRRPAAVQQAAQFISRSGPGSVMNSITVEHDHGNLNRLGSPSSLAFGTMLQSKTMGHAMHGRAVD